jgi:V/A-type H+-transporting ATPase subunit C
MPDYDYGNARLHVMKSRLLSPELLEALAGAGTMQALIAALSKSVYQSSVEAALTRLTGMACVEEAIRNDFVFIMRKIGGFYRGSAGKVVGIFLRAYEIQNLKAILRGLSKHVPAGEIMAILLPIGELELSTMRDLARLNSPREAIDMLASRALPFAAPLLHARGEIPGAESFELELALEQWHYRGASQTIQAEAGRNDPAFYALALDADVTNVLTALRFAHDPHERALLRERLGTEQMEQLFVGPGRIEFGVVTQAGKQDTVAAAVETLAKTQLGPALAAGLEDYNRSNRLSDVERQLRRFRLGWMVRQLTKDPLGIGVVLGYVALKVNELGNLRWIAHGINLGLSPVAIAADLERV